MAFLKFQRASEAISCLTRWRGFQPSSRSVDNLWEMFRWLLLKWSERPPVRGSVATVRWGCSHCLCFRGLCVCDSHGNFSAGTRAKLGVTRDTFLQAAWPWHRVSCLSLSPSPTALGASSPPAGFQPPSIYLWYQGRCACGNICSQWLSSRPECAIHSKMRCESVPVSSLTLVSSSTCDYNWVIL